MAGTLDQAHKYLYTSDFTETDGRTKIYTTKPE